MRLSSWDGSGMAVRRIIRLACPVRPAALRRIGYTRRMHKHSQHSAFPLTVPGARHG
ncbi:hypothetical protein MASSI9I_10209 [Massilia sp. 9I]|nr:hypothetical protein MASSI9I_10209 [Massilia sp. 9I]